MTYRDKRILGILVLLNVIVKILANQTDSPKTDMVEGTEDFTTIKKVLPDRCLAKIDQGPCTQFVHKWYFNKTEGKCRTFPYGGCKGNDNRYNSEDECLYYCVGGADRKSCENLFIKKKYRNNMKDQIERTKRKRNVRIIRRNVKI